MSQVLRQKPTGMNYNELNKHVKKGIDLVLLLTTFENWWTAQTWQ